MAEQRYPYTSVTREGDRYIADASNAPLENYETYNNRSHLGDKGLHIETRPDSVYINSYSNPDKLERKLIIYGDSLRVENSNTYYNAPDGKSPKPIYARSKPAAEAIQQAVRRALRDGKLTDAEARGIEALRQIAAAAVCDDGKIDGEELRTIQTRAAKIAPEKGRG